MLHIKSSLNKIIQLVGDEDTRYGVELNAHLFFFCVCLHCDNNGK